MRQRRVPLRVRLGHADQLSCARMRGRCSPESGPKWGGRMEAALGPGCVKTKSDLVVMPSEGQIFALFCSERDHKPQNSGCVYTTQSFHTAWATRRHRPAAESSPGMKSESRCVAAPATEAVKISRIYTPIFLCGNVSRNFMQGSGRDVVGIMSGIISDKLIIAYYAARSIF